MLLKIQNFHARISTYNDVIHREAIIIFLKFISNQYLLILIRLLILMILLTKVGSCKTFWSPLVFCVECDKTTPQSVNADSGMRFFAIVGSCWWSHCYIPQGKLCCWPWCYGCDRSRWVISIVIEKCCITAECDQVLDRKWDKTVMVVVNVAELYHSITDSWNSQHSSAFHCERNWPAQH